MYTYMFWFITVLTFQLLSLSPPKSVIAATIHPNMLVSSPTARCTCANCEQWISARVHEPTQYKDGEKWAAKEDKFRYFFVNNNNDEQTYNSPNNANAWPAGSPSCPPSPQLGRLSCHGSKLPAEQCALESGSASDSDDVDWPRMPKPLKWNAVLLVLLRQSLQRFKGAMK
jgi:hypothetical protein